MSTARAVNIALPEALRAYMAQCVESSEHGSASEYVQDPVRKDPREQRIQRLRTLVEDGLASGKAMADDPADWDELEAIARGDIE
jgi:antitoxin ParD1/3/4